MKKIYLFLLFTCFTSIVFSQNVVASRSVSSIVGNSIYNFTGSARLDSLDNGSLILRLSDDFSTRRGPDVQIFLSNVSRRLDNESLQLIDLGSSDGINHFNGALDVQVPAETSLNDFSFIVFYCFDFGVLWGGGNFDDVVINDSGDDSFMCEESLVATTAWAPEIDICPTKQN